MIEYKIGSGQRCFRLVMKLTSLTELYEVPLDPARNSQPLAVGYYKDGPSGGGGGGNESCSRHSRCATKDMFDFRGLPFDFRFSWTKGQPMDFFAGSGDNSSFGTDRGGGRSYGLPNPPAKRDDVLSVFIRRNEGDIHVRDEWFGEHCKGQSTSGKAFCSLLSDLVVKGLAFDVLSADNDSFEITQSPTTRFTLLATEVLFTREIVRFLVDLNRYLGSYGPLTVANDTRREEDRALVEREWNSTLDVLASSPNSTGAFLWRVYIRQDEQSQRYITDSKLADDMQQMWYVLNTHGTSNSIEYLACEVLTPACVLADHDILTAQMLDA